MNRKATAARRAQFEAWYNMRRSYKPEQEVLGSACPLIPLVESAGVVYDPAYEEVNRRIDAITVDFLRRMGLIDPMEGDSR